MVEYGEHISLGSWHRVYLQLLHSCYPGNIDIRIFILCVSFLTCICNIPWWTSGGWDRRTILSFWAGGWLRVWLGLHKFTSLTLSITNMLHSMRAYSSPGISSLDLIWIWKADELELHRRNTPFPPQSTDSKDVTISRISIYPDFFTRKGRSWLQVHLVRPVHWFLRLFGCCINKQTLELSETIQEVAKKAPWSAEMSSACAKFSFPFLTWSKWHRKKQELNFCALLAGKIYKQVFSNKKLTDLKSRWKSS